MRQQQRARAETVKQMPTSLAIAVGLALMYAALKPLGDGLLDTSAWVAKILAPQDTEDNESTRQLLKFGQAALMDGWLSNIPLIVTLLFLSSIISGFVYRWWAAIAVYFFSIMLGLLFKIFRGRSAAYYLTLIYHKMVNRAIDYNRRGDFERFEAADSYCRDLAELIVIYQSARLRPPTPKQLKDIPYGDSLYWLEWGENKV